MRSANSVEKMQVFCAWSSLRMSACTVPRTRDSASARKRCVFRGRQQPELHELAAAHAEQPEAGRRGLGGSSPR